MSGSQDDFQRFLNTNRSSFQRLAYRTNGEATVEDLQSDAWLLAFKIGEKRARAIDFADVADCDQVIRYLHTRTVRDLDWKLQGAVRIDEERDDASPLADRLPARNDSDPLVQLLRREIGIDHAAKLSRSYSEASAYVRTFDNFKHSSERICERLAVSHRTLWVRVAKAAHAVATQHSLFDGKVRISKQFRPKRAAKSTIRPPDASPTVDQQSALVLAHVMAPGNLANMRAIAGLALHDALPLTRHLRKCRNCAGRR